MNISNLKRGDIVLVKCKVEAVFTMSNMVCVSTRDCEKGFDAYTDEVIGVMINEEDEKECKEE